MATRYICKCGREVSKSTNADNTGNRDTTECTGCPYLLPWGQQVYTPGQGFHIDVQGYECRMSPTLEYRTELSGRLDDKTTIRIASLDFDFLERVSNWVQEQYPDRELSGEFSRDHIRAVEYVDAGRYRYTLSCAQNKKGIAAKRALWAEFFDETFHRKDLTPDSEKQKILCDIQRGKDEAAGLQAKEEDAMATTYRDPKTDWLYRVSPQPDKGGLYKLQYLDQHNSALFKTLPGAYEGGTNFELVSDVLAARAAKEGWVEYNESEETIEAPGVSEDNSPCNRCRCPDCSDSTCLQAHCDKSDCGLGCMAPDDTCPPALHLAGSGEMTTNNADEQPVPDKTSDCQYFAGVTAHKLGSKTVENVHCKCNDHPLSIACYTYGCKDAVETCRIYWFGRITDDLGHEAPEYLKNCPAEDLKKYFEEETEKCKSVQTAVAAAMTTKNAATETEQTPTTQADVSASSDHGSPADAGLATLSQSDADAASLAATPFDYSGLDAQTVATLHSAETMIRNARKDYVIKVADAVGMAHNELCCTDVPQWDDGRFAPKEDTFRRWCECQGISKTTAYRLLQVSDLLDKSTPNEQRILEQAPTTLLYAAAKPSAPAEAVAAVKSGDIKSMPEYKALLAEIEAERAAREKAEEAQAAAEHEAAEISETALNEMRRANAAEEKVRELESLPIETTATDADELDRLALEKAQTMTEMYKAQITCMQEQNDDLARQLEGSDVERYNHARDIVDAFLLQIKAFRESFWRVAGPLSKDDFKELMEYVTGDAALLAENDWSDFEDGD